MNVIVIDCAVILNNPSRGCHAVVWYLGCDEGIGNLQSGDVVLLGGSRLG